MTKLSAKKRLELIAEIYKLMYDVTDSFEPDRIGADMAYLFGAVAREGAIELDDDSVLLEIFRENIENDHPIWQFITFAEDEEVDEDGFVTELEAGYADKHEDRD